MKSASVSRVLLLAGVCHAAQLWSSPWPYQWPQNWQYTWPDIWQFGWTDNCTNSIITAFETEPTAAFSLSPIASLAAPQLSAMNGTAWEQWYFDSVSASGRAGITIVFARDPSYAFLGEGHLRVEVDAVWENGTTFSSVEFMDTSSVQQCNGQTRGGWSSPGHDYAFEISDDLQTARVTIDTPVMRGTFRMSSFAPAHYVDGALYQSEAASSTESVPMLNWVEAIPTGHVDTNLTLNDTPFSFTGVGGHDRIWAAFNWFAVAEGWHIVRAVLGPYSVVYWAPVSHVDPGTVYPSAFLVEHGKKVFATINGARSEQDDYVLFRKTYGGKLAGGLGDKATGAVLDLVSPSTDKHWTFTIEYANVKYEMGLGEGTGLTGFVGTAAGGLDGSTHSSGVAFAEQVELPQNSEIFLSNYVP